MAGSAYESGHVGSITSLAGVKGQPGRGLRVDDCSRNGALVGVTVFSPNPARKWATIFNAGVPDIYVYLKGAFSTFSVLRTYGVLIFNEDLPWIGEVTVTAAAGSLVQAFEASVE